MSAIVVGSFYGTYSINTFDHGFSARYPMGLLFSSIPLLPEPLQRRRLEYARAARAAGRAGMDCRVLTTGILDPERETSLDEGLAALELPARRFQAELGTGGAAQVIDLSVNGVRVTLVPTISSRAERSPDLHEAAIFLELAEQVFDRFRPDVLLTHGGHPATPWPHPGRAGPGRASGYPGSRIPQRPPEDLSKFLEPMFDPAFTIERPLPEQESPPHAAGHAVIPAGHRSINQMRSRDRHRGSPGMTRTI